MAHISRTKTITADTLTFDEFLEQLRESANNPVEQGTKFELAMAALLPQLPDYQFEEAWRWCDWPDRERLTGLNAQSKIDRASLYYHRDNASEPFSPVVDDDE